MLLAWHGRVGAPPPSDNAVVLIGDSLAVGLDAPLKKELAGYAFSAFHKSGTDLSAWLIGSQAPALAQALAQKPALVLVSLGTNDLFGKVPQATLTARVAEMATRIKKSGAAPLWLHPGKLPFSTAPLTGALSLNSIPTVAQPNIPKQPDGIHPTGIGYQAWGKAIADRIRQKGEPKGPAETTSVGWTLGFVIALTLIVGFALSQRGEAR